MRCLKPNAHAHGWAADFTGLALAGCLLASAATAVAQAAPLPWRWSNPSPHGNNVYDLAFHNGRYWEVTDHGQIYVSSDRVNWTSLASGVDSALRAITFFGDRAVITGEAGTILRESATGAFEAAALDSPTADWLEGVAASDAVLVAVGDNAAIYRSTDGLAWQRVANLPFSDWLRSVAYGGGTFVAVGENGLIGTSTDGLQWDKRSSGVTVALNRVAYSGGVFFATGDAGNLLSSVSQGTNWQSEPTGVTNSLYGFAVGNGTRLVAGNSALLLKAAGQSAWSDQLGSGSLVPAPVWSYYAAVWDGERFVVAGQTGLAVESFTTNSIKSTLWFAEDDSSRDWLWEVLNLPDQSIAVGDRATVLTSPDGIAWHSEYVPDALTNAVFLGIGGSTNLVVAAGSDGSLMYSPRALTNLVTTNEVGTFTNCAWTTNSVTVTNTLDLLGLVWTPVVPSPTANTLQGVCERDGLVVVVGDAGTVLTTTNGATWTTRSIASQPNLSSVVALDSGFVATGAAGAIFTSPDAVNWSARDSGTTDWVYRVRRLNGLLVAVGQNGLILTSPDGVTWSRATSGTDAWLTDATFADGRYFVCGTQGTVLSSTNAVDWVPLSLITGKSLYGLASRPGQLLAVGVEDVILRALLVATTPVAITAYSHADCGALTADQFSFRGLVDQSFRLESSADLESWQSIRSFTLGSPDLDFWLQRTNLAPAQGEFFRTVAEPQ